MKKLILAIALLLPTTALADTNKYAPFGYAGTAHITTELCIKTMNAVMGENYRDYHTGRSDPSLWNHFFSSALVFTVMAHTETTFHKPAAQKTNNIVGIAVGVITGNLFQIEW